MANRKAREKRRKALEREARERRREADRGLAERRARTAEGTATGRADRHPAILKHDAAVVPLIQELRGANATWQEIAAGVGWLSRRHLVPDRRVADRQAPRNSLMMVPTKPDYIALALEFMGRVEAAARGEQKVEAWKNPWKEGWVKRYRDGGLPIRPD